jgi:multidrug efflux pump subunit AcrB
MPYYPAMIDVSHDLKLNTPELQVNVDRQRSGDVGVHMADIGSAARLIYSGEGEISTYKEGAEQYSVTMQLLPEQRDNPDVLVRLMVPAAKQGQVRLESVASTTLSVGLARYNRLRQRCCGRPTRWQGGCRAESARFAPSATGLFLSLLRPGAHIRWSTRNMVMAVPLASIFICMSLREAFMEANRVRLHLILMTTLSFWQFNPRAIGIGWSSAALLP